MASTRAELTDTPSAPLFGVETSLSGRRWHLKPAEDSLALALSQRHGLPDIVGRLMAARDIGLEDAGRFLGGTLRDDLPDPHSLIDMDAAASRIAAAIQAREAITVFGDYDVDGATSAALLIRYVQSAGGQIDYYIPDRQAEGYGPNPNAMRTIAARGTKLVITVDCGIQAFDALEAARTAGLETIILDHHKAEMTLPPACAVVNPNRHDDTSGLGYLAAVGVTFLTLIAVQRALRDAGFFNETRREIPLLKLLDLVALGTVADVVPLVDVNRLLVRQGLKVMAGRENLGLRALGDVANLDDRPDSGHLGFVFGPRVNAGGRVGRSDLGTRLLSTQRPDEAAEIAQELNALNQERRALEAEVQRLALEQIGDPGDVPVIVAAGKGWHPGVIGIVASRVKERFERPAVIIGVEDGVGKGSGRSITGVDLGNAILDARALGLLSAGGGHAMAAGLTISEDQIEAFTQHITKLLAPAVTQARLSRGLGVDAVMNLAAATAELVQDVESIGPYGVGNPAPRFAFEAVRLEKVDVVGQDHVRLFLKDRSGGRLKAISFGSAETPMGQALLAGQGQSVHVVGRLKRDDWGNTPKAELHLEDAAIISV